MPPIRRESETLAAPTCAPRPPAGSSSSYLDGLSPAIATAGSASTGPGLLSIDLGGIRENVRRIAARIGSVDRVAAVVKADAYGLGAGPIARAIARAGVRRLVVLHAAEAAVLADRVPATVRFLVLAPVPPAGIDDLARDGRIEVTVHDEPALAAAAAVGRRTGRPLPVHLEIDCGLGRAGVRPEHAPAFAARVAAARDVRLAGVFTHFSAAECDPVRTGLERERFVRTLATLAAHAGPDVLRHAANTHGTLGRDDARFDLCRVGRGWAGLGPQAGGREPWPAASAPRSGDLVPVLRWTCPLMHVRRIEAGDPVGYGSRWTADEPTWSGLLPVGYAHGLPEGAGAAGRGTGCIGGARVRVLGDAAAIDARIVGTVSMDQCAVAVAVRHDPGGRTVRAGASVELVGRDPDAPNLPERFAADCGVRPLALLSSIGPRVPRRWDDAYDGDDVKGPGAASAAVPAVAGPAVRGSDPIVIQAGVPTTR